MVKRETHGEARLGFPTFSFVLLVRGQPCLLTRDLGWKHLLLSEVRVWIYGSFENQTNFLQREGLPPKLAAVRFIQIIFSELLVTVPPERLSRRRTTLAARGIKEKQLPAAHTKHRPPLPAPGKSPTLDVRLLCLEGSLFSSQREHSWEGGRGLSNRGGRQHF